MSDSDVMLSLFGIYNNFDEPTPLANKKETLLGVTIAFMV
jgi:hypothetical protein